VPGNERIIERGRFEVNGAARVALVLIVVAAAGACGGRERQADRLYREAAESIENGEFDEAVKRLQRLVDDYAGTEAARKAEGEIVLYRGLRDAVDKYPERRAAESMIRTARAIERYHARKRTWPASLDDLVPKDLAAVPADPWGNALVYERKPSGKGYKLSCFGADAARGGVGEDADTLVEDGRFLEGGLH
jgi:hypothetical protein